MTLTHGLHDMTVTHGLYDRKAQDPTVNSESAIAERLMTLPVPAQK